MGRREKEKGSRVERELVIKHKRAGIPCIRVPLSGGGSISGDLLIRGKQQFRAEVKARKDGAGFATLEKWLKGNDVLVLKRDHQDPFVAMSWDVYLDLMVAYLHISDDNATPSKKSNC